MGGNHRCLVEALELLLSPYHLNPRVPLGWGQGEKALILLRGLGEMEIFPLSVHFPEVETEAQGGAGGHYRSPQVHGQVVSLAHSPFPNMAPPASDSSIHLCPSF